MGFVDAISTAAADIIRNIGQTATYTPSAGDPVTLYVDLSYVIDGQPDGLAVAWTSRKTIECLLSDCGKEPDKAETFLVGSTTYTVTEVIENNGTFVKLAVK